MLKQIFFLLCLATVAYSVNVSSCGTLLTANTVYTLTQNITNNTDSCITFGNNNQTLDCQGFWILSNTSNTSTIGIAANSRTTPTIKNCNIQGFNRGIESQSSPAGIVDNTTVNGSLAIGMYLRPNTDGFTLTNSQITETVTAVYALVSTGAFNISNVSASSGAGAAFQLQSLSAVNVNNVTAITNGTSAGIYVLSSNNADIRNSLVYTSGSYGILGDTAINMSIRNTTVIANSTTTNANGIYARIGSDNVVISNVSVTSYGLAATSIGIYSGGTTLLSNNSQISNFTVDGFATGVQLTSKLYNSTLDCGTGTIRNAAIALTTGGNNVTITNCAMGTNITRGVYIQNGANSNVKNVSINATSSAPFYFEGATACNNTIDRSFGNSSSYYALLYFSNACNNTVKNSNFVGTGSSIIRFESLASPFGNFFINNTFTGKPTSVALDFSAAHNNVVANNTLNLPAVSYGMYLSASSNNTLSNNTLKNASTAITAFATSGNNTFLENNMTGLTWVNDLNGTNKYNDSTHGNIYYASNGTAASMIYNVSSSTNQPWANQGSARPFNQSNTNKAGGNWSGLGADWFPYTLNPLNLTFINQTPADLNATNAIGINTTIWYNITHQFGATNLVDNASVRLYYELNDTTTNCKIYTNGSLFCGFGSVNQTTSSGSQYEFILHDNQVLPATYNLPEQTMENTTHQNQTMTGASSAAFIELLNVSNTSQFGWFEMMINGTGVQPARIYYCNSSYSNATDYTTSANCAQFGSMAANQPYNHTHSAFSSHQVFPFAVVNGSISSVAVTSRSYFIVRYPVAGSTLNAWYVNLISRIGAAKTTTDGGLTWANLAGTLDAHLHQFNGNTSLTYYVCANSTIGSTWCSANRSDLLQTGGLPPTAGQVLTPYLGQIIINGTTFNVTWTPSTSPNGYAINYTASLLYPNFTFNRSIGSSTNQTWINYSANATGTWIIQINATDALGQSTVFYSDAFEVLAVSLSAVITYPANTTFVSECSMLLKVNTSDNLNSSFGRTLSCSMWQQDTLDIYGAVTLFGTQNFILAGNNTTVMNWSIPINGSNVFIANCTYSIPNFTGLNTSTASGQWTFTGRTLCGVTADANNKEILFIALIVFAIGMFIFRESIAAIAPAFIFIGWLLFFIGFYAIITALFILTNIDPTNGAFLTLFQFAELALIIPIALILFWMLWYFADFFKKNWLQ